jgi:hypothetical protein
MVHQAPSRAFAAPSLRPPPVLGERHVFLPPAVAQERRASAERSGQAVDSPKDPPKSEAGADSKPGKGAVGTLYVSCG